MFLVRSRSRSRSPEPENEAGLQTEILVNHMPLLKFKGPGEGEYEHETWHYVVAVPDTLYSLRMANMADDAQDMVVEIEIDGQLMSRNFVSGSPKPYSLAHCVHESFASTRTERARLQSLPKFRTKVKSGVSPRLNVSSATLPSCRPTALPLSHFAAGCSLSKSCY